MIHPALSHPICTLDLEERIRRTRADALARSVAGAGFLARMFGRRSRTRNTPDPSEARGVPDIWAAFRL